MSAYQMADLSACDREPIHIPEMIQPFGALLAMTLPDLTVVRASENLTLVTGIAAQDAIGEHLGKLIGENHCRQLAAALEHGELHSVSPTLIRFPASGMTCQMYINSIGETLIAEFEPAQDEPVHAESLLLKGEVPFHALHQCRSHRELASLLAREMRRATEFDRAIVYRFDEDWHGVVIAEAKNDVYSHSFMDHHFPASDIPVQARKLFSLNRLRMIPDVSYAPVRVLSHDQLQGTQIAQQTRAPLDMTYCMLRNVAPVHLEYLANMGVGASLTVSIMNGDKLWGMVTCHNASPRYLPHTARLRCKVLAELASYAVASIERERRARLHEARQADLKIVQDLLAAGTDFPDAIRASGAYMLRTLAADAMIVCIGEQMIDLGMTLPQGVHETIVHALEQELNGNVAHSRNLSSLSGSAGLAATSRHASGALYCKLQDKGDYFIAIRREVIEARNWAGNPSKPVDLPDTGRLHPRKSFELWQEAVRGYSKRWNPVDVDVALELRRMLLERREQIARRQFEGAWRLERDRSTDILEAMGEGFMLVDRNFRILRVNAEGIRLTGKKADELLGFTLWEVWPDAYASASGQAYRRAMHERVPLSVEKEFRHADSGKLWLHIRIYPSTDGLALFFSDIGERKRMEAALRRMNDTLEERVAMRTAELGRAHEQLLQSQKMEALGQLTGGVAHDFNNLLASIVSSHDLLRLRLESGNSDELARYVAYAAAATERAAALTHRLLSFARKQKLEAAPVDVAALVKDVKVLIEQAVGASVRIDVQWPADLWQTFCDPHQLENALLNLAINSRDAMPEGGVLSITARNIGAEEAQRIEGCMLNTADYVRISVADTGTGMPPEVAERAFDPFFTTKPEGKGTGLGLSMIYGFVRQSGGEIRIISAPARGTTVDIYLPRFNADPGEARISTDETLRDGD